MARLLASSARPAHRARTLRGLVASAATVLALTGSALTSPVAQASPATSSKTSSVTSASLSAERGFVANINASRHSAGRSAVSTSPALTAVARAWAQSMARSQRLAHNPKVWTQVSGWHYLGENVGVGGTTTTLHSAFMHSAPHRANILSADYSRVGIGVAYGSGRTWVVEVFDRPFAKTSPRKVTKKAAPGYGSRGPVVRAAQRKLHVKATGYFGTITLTKVRTFQKQHHLRVSGRLDTGTARLSTSEQHA